MSMDKSTPIFTVKTRTEYDLDNEDDRKIIKMFEAEIQPFLSQKKEYFGKVISKIEVYMCAKGLMKYSEKYPYGAVVGNRLHEFNDTTMKWSALQKLWDRREYAQKQGEMVLV